VPKETAAAMPAAAAPEPSEPTDRMLAAILPDGGRAWFLKVVGPLPDVASRADEINKFFESVRVAPGKPHPDWQLPKGWTQEEGSQMRAATIRIPTDSKPLELSVIPLPWTGGEAELLSNVNRWRGQLQLPPIGVVALAKCTRELKAGDATMTLVDLQGTMKSTGMTPPFAGGPFSGSSADLMGGPGAMGAGSLPAGHPPIAGASSPGSSAAVPFKYDAPKSWQSMPATGIRRAEFQVTGDAGKALVTVMDFPASAGPMITDPLANVNRWRSEVGLAPIAKEKLSDVTDTIEVDGVSGTLVDAVPDATKPEESKADQGTLAAMVTRGEKVWFFKIKGDRDLVAKERENFQSFLKSVRFAPGGGTGDGN
jgi:hypothetical protein